MTHLTEKTAMVGLTKYVPQGHSPKLYIEMAKHLMGTDNNGNARPFEDLAIFMMTAKRTGLDPMAKQIYPIYRWDSKLGAEKLTIQVGIDGMRATAQKTGEYAGSDDAVFEEADGKPVKATITVYKINSKTGERMPITASARWSEYVQTYKDKKTNEWKPSGMWAKMPYNQLAKCAEALALRKAFPNDLSGVYSEDEMAQAEKLELPTPPTKMKKVEVTDSEGMTHDVEVPADHPAVAQNEVVSDETMPAPQVDGGLKTSEKPKTVPQGKSISEIRARLKTMGNKSATQAVEGEIVQEVK